jgi:hypothetical protein
MKMDGNAWKTVGKGPAVSDITTVLGAFRKNRSYASRGALWFYLGKKMPYPDLKAVLKRLERDGVVRISKGKVTLREMPELTKVKIGQKLEPIEDPTNVFGPLLVYYKQNGEHRITSTTTDLKYMKAMREVFREKREARK